MAFDKAFSLATAFIVLAGFAVAIKSPNTAPVLKASTTGFANVVTSATAG